jgi:hypothetical protein
MTHRAMQFVLAGIILFAASNLNAQGPQKRGDRPHPGAAASPGPVSAAPNASSSTAIFNAPQHSPDQLDFGFVSAGASSLKTFTLTTNASGNVSVTIPPGPFRLAEFRELGALQGGSKNSTTPLNAGGFSPQVKSRITYREGQSGPFQWSMAPNEQIQLDIVFAPKSQTIPGMSSAVMNVNGPGPHGNWVVTIPLRGTTNGMKALSPDNSQQGTGKLPQSGKAGGSSPAAISAGSVHSVNSTAISTPPPPPASAKASSSQQVAPPGSGSVKGPSTSIASVPPKGGGLSGPVSGESQLALTPTHSPDALYFGAVWQGDSAKQTFRFDNTDGGYIHVDTPLPFQVSEIRALTAGGGSKNSGKGLPQNIPLGPQVKTRVKFTPNQTGPYTALVDPGANVEVDVILQPPLQSATGDKSAVMKITGPGSIHDWGMSIPLHGTVQSGLEASPSQLWAIGNDQGAYLNVIIHGTNNNVSGTLKGGGVLPPGISITPQSVNVPASGTSQTQLWLSFNAIPTDLKARPLQIVFEASNHSTSSQIQFVGVPGTALEINSGDRGDCGVSRASLSLQIMPPRQYKNQSTKGKRGWVFLGWNYDLLNNRYVEMTAESGGVQLFSHFPFTVPQNTSDQVREFSPYMEDFDVTPEQWARILQGPARFGCRQWDTTSGGAIAPKGSFKWTAAVKGLKF